MPNMKTRILRWLWKKDANPELETAPLVCLFWQWMPSLLHWRLSSNQVQDWHWHWGVHSATRSRPCNCLTPLMWMQIVPIAHSPDDTTGFHKAKSPTNVKSIQSKQPTSASHVRKVTTPINGHAHTLSVDTVSYMFKTQDFLLGLRATTNP